MSNFNDIDSLTAISPLDGRYFNKLTSIKQYFSEFGLIKYRLQVEIDWLKFLSNQSEISELKKFNDSEVKFLDSIINSFNLSDAKEIKEIEKTTNHDVKAVEYFIKSKLNQHSTLSKTTEFIHFACTSEDINNLSHALILKNAKDEEIIPKLNSLAEKIKNCAVSYRNISMLSRTHGQDASPTTMGKEWYYFYERINKKIKQINSLEIYAKFNGAVGNYNAHLVAYPEINWQKLSKEFIESFGLQWNNCTIQIEPHDYMADLFSLTSNLNTILIDFCRDIWGYISLDYFKQKVKPGEVGSSTMPHKVNPICFENAEGNLGVANALLQHLAAKLPISRWQRDLSDSTVLRNFGVGFSHAYLAYGYIVKGIETLSINEAKITDDLSEKWHLLAEPVQTVMRKYSIENSYEKLKELTRGEKITKELLQSFITTLEIPEIEREKLLKLTPSNYTGIADQIVS